MEYQAEARIRHHKGIHTRVAAMIVQYAHELMKEFHVTLYLNNLEQDKIFAGSLALVISLKARYGTSITVSGVGESPKEAVSRLVVYLEGDFTRIDLPVLQEVDQLIEDNRVTAEHIFESIVNGIIAVDGEDNVTAYNKAAEEILQIPASQVLGRKVYDVIPTSRLHIVNKTGVAELGSRQVIGEKTTITNRTPILVDGKVRGAVAVFEDVSALEKISWELTEIKELQERLQLILASVQEGICVVNPEGFITYVNPAYLHILGRSWEDVVGRSLSELSPDGLRAKVLSTGEPIAGVVREKDNGISVIASVNPLVVDGKMAGVISVIQDMNEMQNVMDQLQKASERAEYLEQELRRTRKRGPAFSSFIGECGKVMEALSIAGKAAETSATVLIRGESGTGKELVAEGIHEAGPRRGGPFIRVNCGAIPINLMESEFFGHEKGAFTGAVKRRMGKFELAHRGTLFLDEIGELDKNMQVKLLRVLQKKEFERVGGETTLQVDVRVIAATNQNLERMLDEGTFREDLYYRLNVIPIFLPPLRERTEDIPLLVEHFFQKISGQKLIRGMQPEAIQMLLRYRWPGNVRELENLLERMLMLSEDGYLRTVDLPQYIQSAGYQALQPGGREEDHIFPWEVYEREIIAKALRICGSFNSAGKALGLTHNTVAAKARKYQLLGKNNQD